MKKQILYTIAAIMILGGIFVGCKKDLLYANFTVNRSNSFQIPQLPQPITLPEGTDTMSLKGDKKFEINDTRIDQVKELVCSDVSFIILNPESRTFSFLENIQLYVEAEGLPRKLVAERKNVPDNIGRQLAMETKENVNLAPYAKKESFTIVYGGKTDEATDSKTKVEIDYVFDVTAKVIK